MSAVSLAQTKDAFNAFRVESVWLRTIYDTSFALYSSGQEIDTLLQKIAPRFFVDLNQIIIEYWVLVVCRLTDLASTRGRENLTVANMIDSLKRLGISTDAIEREAVELQIYRDVLNHARNRVVSHADKATFLQPELLGEHTEHEVTAFLEHLQIFNDLVGDALNEGPLDFRGISGPGDVHDLLRILRNAA
jgi:hypothetical protein